MLFNLFNEVPPNFKMFTFGWTAIQDAVSLDKTADTSLTSLVYFRRGSTSSEKASDTLSALLSSSGALRLLLSFWKYRMYANYTLGIRYLLIKPSTMSTYLQILFRKINVEEKYHWGDEFTTVLQTFNHFNVL